MRRGPLGSPVGILSVLTVLLLSISVSTVSAQNFTVSSRTSSTTRSTTSSQNTSALQSDITTGDTASETATSGIDYDHVEEDEAEQLRTVFQFDLLYTQVKWHHMEHPSAEPTGVSTLYNPLYHVFANYYVVAGRVGRPQWLLAPDYTQWWANGASPCAQHRGYESFFSSHSLYQVRRPYTLLSYGGSLNSDNQLHIIHSQNIIPRWNVAFNYHLINSEGVYTRTALKNNYLDVTTNYYSSDARYQVEAALQYRNYNMNENGGISDDSYFYSSRSSTRAGVPVNLYDASNHWRSLGLYVHQSFNTVRQFQRMRPITVKVTHDTLQADSVTIATVCDSIVGYDTLPPQRRQILNTGVFGMDLHYYRSRRNYDDYAPTDYYTHFFFNTDTILDSTYRRRAEATLYWTNDAYSDSLWLNPIKVTGGLRTVVQQVNYSALEEKHWLSAAPFVRAVVTLGRLTLQTDAYTTTSAYINNGDNALRMQLHMPLLKGQTSVTAGRKATAPDVFYYCYASNNYQWNIEDYHKVICRYGNATYERDWLKPHADTLGRDIVTTLSRAPQLHTAMALSCSQLSNNVWLKADSMPYQSDGHTLLWQASLRGSLTLGWFHYDMNHLLQHSSNTADIPVPTFVTRNSLYADFWLFHQALRVQTGFDLRYHTRYYAPGYNPALAAFYHQEEVKVGGYLWADFFVTLKIKQATLYARVNHLNALWESHTDYFLLPHIPGEDCGLYFGVNWRFYD